MAGLYYSAVVVDNADPEQQGRLMLEIPGLLGDEDPAWPDWVPTRVGGAGPAAIGHLWVPPIGALVTVEVVVAGPPVILAWRGSELGQVNTVPAELLAGYPDRAGFSSPRGRNVLALGDDAGFLLYVGDDATAAIGTVPPLRNYLAIRPDGSIQAATASGSLFRLETGKAALISDAGDTLILDAENGVVLSYQDASAMLALSSGLAALWGTAVQLNGGTIELGGGSAPPTHPYALTLALLADLATAATEASTGLIALGQPGTALAALATKIATSLSAGPPYLSTRIFGD